MGIIFGGLEEKCSATVFDYAFSRGTASVVCNGDRPNVGRLTT